MCQRLRGGGNKLKPAAQNRFKSIVAGLLCRDGHILIAQRARTQRHALKWEFPGGKVEPGETSEQALRRELVEELAVESDVGPLFQRIRHRYQETGELQLSFYWVTAFRGEPQNQVFEQIRWVRPQELADFDFLDADRPIVAALARLGELPG